MTIDTISSAPSTLAPGAPAAPAPLQTQRPAQRWPRLWGRRMWLLLALGVLLLVYRAAVIRYTGMSLFFDEALYWDWSRHLQWGYYSKPPAAAALVAASTALFGDSILAVKAGAMACYVATAVAMVGLARALWPTSSGVRTGVVAGALFLTSPMVGLLGMFISSDAPLLLCWTLAAWALWRAQVTNRLGLWLLFGALVGLGLLSKYTMAAIGITALWTLWGVQGPKRGLLRVGPWAALAAALVVVSPHIMWNAQMGFPTFHHVADISVASSRPGGPAAAALFALGQLLIVGPVALAAGLLLHRKVHGGVNEVAGQSQWASSSQMLPPSQWAASTQLGGSSTPPTSSQLSSTLGADQAARRPTRSSAYYLASVTSYRYLVALSAPLLVMAIVQALLADARLNWAAPAMVGVFLLIATRLSLPLVPLSAPRPQRWFWAVLASNVALTAAVIHARDLMGEHLPAKADVLVRMRGWEAAFGQLESLLDDPRVQGLSVVSDQRTLLAQASYQWRAHRPHLMAWNPTGARSDHYQLQQSMPNKVGQDVLLLTDKPEDDAILSRFAFKRELGRAAVQVAPDRQLTLHVILARGFVGYDNQTYREQSGTENDRTEDKSFMEPVEGRRR